MRPLQLIAFNNAATCLGPPNAPDFCELIIFFSNNQYLGLVLFEEKGMLD